MRNIPSLVELQKRVATDIKARLDIVDENTKMVIDAFSASIAAELKLIYLYQNDISRNLFPDTADTAADGGELNRIGQIQLNRQPYPATDGIYTARVLGDAGSVINASVTFKSNDDSKSPGNLYIIDQEYTLTGTLDQITIRSLDAGPKFLLEINNFLTATEPLIGVDQQIKILSVTTQPTAAESIDLYRKNILDAIQLEPQGGAKTDYRLWASDAQGVERVFPYAKNGSAGTVQVFVEATKVDSADGRGTPGGALITAVNDVIEYDPDTNLPNNQRGRRPVTAIVEVLPIVTKPVDFEILGLQTNTLAIRDSIATNLAAFIFDVRPYIAGADLPRDKNDVLSTVKTQSIVSDTIGNTNGFTDFKLYVDGVEVNTFTFAGGNIPYVRNITYS